MYAYVYNWYSIPSRLFVFGESEISSTEGTPQGVGIRSKALRATLCRLGSKYVYYPEATKHWLIIKEDFKEKQIVPLKICTLK